MNLEFKRKLPTLQEIKAMYPLDDALAAHKKDTDATLKNIFSGKDNRLLLVIGPCSADREDAVLDYISRLRRVQEKVADKIVIVPRIYTNKPRTISAIYAPVFIETMSIPEGISGSVFPSVANAYPQ